MNYNNYIGLPYKDNGRDESGIDCWGLVRLIYKNEYNIDLPSYTEEYSGRSDPTIGKTLDAYKSDNWVRVSDPEPGCVVLFNIMGEPTHVGVYLGEGKFIHSRGGLDSVIESVSNFKWKSRIEGYYKYAPVTEIQVSGAPHPLRTQVLMDAAEAGSTIQEVIDTLNKKYQIGQHLAKTVVVMVDGEIIPQDKWATTVLKENQALEYKFLPRGDNARRMLIVLAVMIIAGPYLTEFGEYMASANGAGFGTAAQWTTAAQAATMIAATRLALAIVPIRPPNDPGQTKGLNLFGGASNQANKFGPIPVVLGTVRMTAMLGAQPYVETATDTSLLNLMLIWGFGPLEISDVQVGSKDIDQLYDESSVDNKVVPVHYYGYENTSADNVDSKYPTDIEQIYPNVSIVNEDDDPNDGFVVASLANKCEDIDVVLSFPEGMRSIATDTGDVHPAQAEIEIQVREKDGNGNPITGWTDYATFGAGTYNSGNYESTAATFDLLGKSMTYTTTGWEGDYSTAVTLYQWHVIAVGGGQLTVFSGTPYDNPNGTISTELLNTYKTGSYKTLTGETSNYKVYPDIPTGFLKLYSIKMYGPTRVVTDQQTHLNSYPGVQGFGLSYQDISIENMDGYQSSTGVKITVKSGLVSNSAQTAPGAVQQIFSSRSFSNTTVRNGYGGTFLKQHGVWNTDPDSGTFDHSQVVNFPYTGYYIFEGSCDDYGTVYVDGVYVMDLPQGGWNGSVKTSVYVTAGSHTVRYKVTDTGGAEAAGLNITFTANEGLNAPSTNKTRIVFGAEGFFYKRKDAFNFVHRIRGLSRGYYDVKITRTNSSNAEAEGTKRRAYFASSLYSVVGYDRHNDNGTVKKIITEPLNAPIARSYIRVQSTGKVNGTVDGINALVKSKVWDWDQATNKWVFRASNNPASLFLHVLSHPANAYRIPIDELKSKINEQAFIAWHTFCKTGVTGVPLTYNNVVVSVTSVMDLLRDIAAAGKASPAFVDGKWDIVIDKPRTSVVQHFTPHNSWGFEASKALPRIPDAFRISFVNENKAYQSDEIFVYKDPTKYATAKIFEEIQLPGVTNVNQARHLGQWHMAQLLLRPETYTINVDFEYLICTRGDLVRVTHDVPKWGTGSGRLTVAETGSTQLHLSEEFSLTAGVTYDIRVRTQTNNSVLLRLATHTTGLHSTVTLATPLPSGINAGDLFMLGEVGKETQELIVLSVEPSNNLSAKLTLCDYSAEMYTTDLSVAYPVFNPNISTSGADVVTNGIFVSPTISGFISDSPQSEEISNGVYQNVLQISFVNNATAGKNAQKIQLQIIPGDELFDSNSLQNVYEVLKEIGYVRIVNLTTGGVYKVRARYRNNTGTISGPWSQTYTITNIGRNTNTNSSPSLAVDLDTTYIVVKPTYVAKQADFAAYEYRLYKDTGTEDFWDLNVTDNNIKVIRTSQDARFDLRDQPMPRISTEGVTYRIACRSVDKSNNYSDTSTLGTIVVKTIQ